MFSSVKSFYSCFRQTIIYITIKSNRESKHSTALGAVMIKYVAIKESISRVGILTLVDGRILADPRPQVGSYRTA